MAKRRETPPVNPLSADLIAAAIAPVEEDLAANNKQKPAPKPAPNFKNAKVKRKVRDQKTLRVRFPDTEFEDNKIFASHLCTLMSDEEVQSKVTESDITRALWSLARRAVEAMDELEAKAPKTPRPPNGDWIAKAEYDDAIARFLHLAIKRTKVGD